MPRAVMTEPVVVVEPKVRGIIQITQEAEMWNCRLAIYNSPKESSIVKLNAEKVVELFKVCGVPQPIEQAASHVVEFHDGPNAEVFASFGFDSSVA